MSRKPRPTKKLVLSMIRDAFDEMMAGAMDNYEAEQRDWFLAGLEELQTVQAGDHWWQLQLGDRTFEIVILERRYK